MRAILCLPCLPCLLCLPLFLAFAPPRPAAARDDLPAFFVEGYTDRLSYLPGEEVVFHLSAGVPRCALEVARLGAEREVVLREPEVAVGEHPVPEDASSHGCDWPAAYRLEIPREWRSGYYEVRLRVEDRGGKFIGRNRRSAEGELFFIVRSPEPGVASPILLQLATNTYNAYNNWGGSSLYGYHGRAGLQGHRVSFDRPLAGLFDRWERQFVAWAEAAGYTLEFAANTDLERVPELLERYRLVLSVGHDEYWSAGMRDALEAFIGRGGNAAFFSGNSVCWQVRLEDDGRALLCWKQWYNQDPVYKTDDHRFLTSLWSDHLVNRPENTLTGVGFLWGGYHRSHGQFMDGSGAFTVHRPEHWVFADTGLERDQTFGGASTIVGYECDGCELRWEDGLPFATGRDGTPASFVVLGTAPARWHPDDSEWYERWERGRTGNAVMGVYTRGGGIVFTAGTTDWSHGLAGKDPAVERITRNVLDRLSR
jgi:hypothetical protein